MTNVLEKTITDILQTVYKEEEWLMSLSEDVITVPRNGQGRTIKQLLGHLVDSASNNHQRIVRLQYENDLAFPDYTQYNDRWIAIQAYQEAKWENLVQLWKFYNLHIAHILCAVDAAALDNYWHDYTGARVTLREMIEVYAWHLDLHITEIHKLA